MREDGVQSGPVRLHDAVSSALRKRRICLIASVVIIAVHLPLVLVADMRLKPITVLNMGVLFLAPIVGFPILVLISTVGGIVNDKVREDQLSVPVFCIPTWGPRLRMHLSRGGHLWSQYQSFLFGCGDEFTDTGSEDCALF